MSIFEQTSSRPGSRFGKLSSNMFFIRNTAKPKRVRHIEGILIIEGLISFAKYCFFNLKSSIRIKWCLDL